MGDLTDNQYWLCVWLLCILLCVCGVVALTLSTQRKLETVERLIKEGAPPLEAGCAIYDTGSESVTCILVAAGKR